MSNDRTKAKLTLHDQLVRLWADERFTDGRNNGEGLREFVTAYLLSRFDGGDQDAIWKATKARLGLDKRPYHLRRLYAADAPRFEPVMPRRFGCEVPKTKGVNAGKPCGRSGMTFRVTDPATGEWRMATYCRQHEAQGNAARAAERALVNVPEPMPNTGGLLPCYIKAGNWPDLYVSVSPRWKPPYVGIVADDWPVMAKVHTPPVQKLGLTAIPGGREQAPATEPPALRLVVTR